MTPLKASDTHGGYIPTDEDKKVIIKKADHFKLSGDGIFHTIQGEGLYIGQPCTFVRLQFCNLKCTRCDAYYTWKNDEKEFYENIRDIHIDDLTNKIIENQLAKGVKEIVKSVVFTGGEPLLQQDLISKWIERNPDWFVQIETNGTIPLKSEILKNCHFNISPKLVNSGNDHMSRYRENVLKSLIELKSTCKFVFKTINDIKEIENVYSYIPKSKISLMPEGVTKEENALVFEDTIDYIVASGYSVSLRGQNIMRDGAKRGV